jgi:hypothetical protein
MTRNSFRPVLTGARCRPSAGFFDIFFYCIGSTSFLANASRRHCRLDIDLSEFLIRPDIESTSTAAALMKVK